MAVGCFYTEQKKTWTPWLYNTAHMNIILRYGFLGVHLCYSGFSRCARWMLFLGDRNELVLVGLLSCHLTPTASRRCVFVYTCANTPPPPKQPCRAVLRFPNANCIPSKLVLSQRVFMQPWVSLCRRFIWVHRHVYICAFYSGLYRFRLLPFIIFKCVCMCAPV